MPPTSSQVLQQLAVETLSLPLLSLSLSHKMNPRTDKLVRRTTMVATVVASYFLLTADYGPEPNALDPIKNAILSAEHSAKEFIFGPKKGIKEAERGKPNSNSAKDHQ